MKRPSAVAFVAALVAACALLAGCSETGNPVDFNAGAPGDGAARARPVDADTLMPTGPKSDFRITRTLDDGTHIARTTLRGPKSGVTGSVWVWAPKEYHDPKYRKSGFPVLIALPGGLGSPKEPGGVTNYWVGGDIELQENLTRWTAEGKSLPFIVVMPMLNPDTQYHDASDIPGRQKMGTWLTEDVVQLAKANFRTFKSRDGWAFMGSSSGGFAGLKSVLKHPEKFKAAIASGPDIVPDSPLWAGHRAQRDANDPAKLAQRLLRKGGPDIYLAFQAGSREPAAVTTAMDRFRRTYGKGPIHTAMQLIPGGRHNAWDYQKGMAAGSIKFISDRMKAPVASGH
ncbi:S-formylglutathione hydrolase FrmB [Streptomyces sp. 2224.1]|uniref:alpha/beta hydrolase n=1 Tax=unclassified Streptomyces TaxID=2593676 RepID=UPI000886BF2B|nr:MULTISPECIES: alpha/beta hydrolase-fold protein [unclassified Streptomyces]PBC86618.1 S-formylglutathione hydrolase FrmB [Streptomyces sp. 2321.6]SDQ78152.1 S-formylglutathione hydrolase FrmB [Streptomyces sp. KS_16]SED55479.1 S-formylglutathione hydrolase FrmB [Streptomyces sp. 2112.3]SED86771.1 S-formylglutathione hydrolase FrmB [Streptomyces sp. 2224.1]SEE04103.1 S-formylglutathione hydrolase FrmB [Streptomyces sp. 2133.1]